MSLLGWRSSNAPNPSTTNVRRYVTVGGHALVLNILRRGSETQAPPPLEVRGILLHTHHDLDSGTRQSWKDRANMINNRPPFVATVDYNNLHKHCKIDFQTRILKFSYSNFAKCFGQRVSRSNRNTSNNKNRNVSSTELCVSVSSKLQFKRKK